MAGAGDHSPALSRGGFAGWRSEVPARTALMEPCSTVRKSPLLEIPKSSALPGDSFILHELCCVT